MHNVHNLSSQCAGHFHTVTSSSLKMHIIQHQTVLWCESMLVVKTKLKKDLCHKCGSQTCKVLKSSIKWDKQGTRIMCFAQFMGPDEEDTSKILQRGPSGPQTQSSYLRVNMSSCQVPYLIENNERPLLPSCITNRWIWAQLSPLSFVTIMHLH
jgi:hypothetical protein